MSVNTTKKILNLLLLLSFLIGYLEWGKGYSMFIFQGEMEILQKGFSSPDTVAHPFTIIPFAGQLLLLYTLFQRTPSTLLTFASLGFMNLLMLFLFCIGIMSGHYKMIFFELPFIIASVITVIYHRKHRQKTSNTTGR